ncbi:MAG: 30S ribosomal protein S2 [Patescibacteria group bacterium]|nr:30S ribosomal protein S2 [Patescibacteria group bacterium]
MVKADNDFGIDIKEMAEAGLHFGHKTSKTHPKMKPFIHGTRNTINLIDLDKTKEGLEKALDVVKKLIAEKKTLIIIGTKIQAKKLVEDFAKEHELLYVSERWLGGTISNFEVIKKRIDYFNDLKVQKEKGEWEKYKKKERGQLDLEMERMGKKFEGIKNLQALPDAIFVLDIEKDSLAIKEARSKGIMTIGVSDANADPSSVDWPIPANDDAVSAIKYILAKLSESIKKGKKLQEEKEEQEKKKEEKEEKKEKEK